MGSLNLRPIIAMLVLAPAFWFLFVDSKSAEEMLVGFSCASLTVVFTVFVWRCSPTKLKFLPRDLCQVWHVPWHILSGVYEILRVLWKDLLGSASPQSHFRVCGFDGSRHDPVRKGRTILNIAYTTAAPNFIILGVDTAQSRMLFHQIQPTSIPEMTRDLGARA